MKNKYSEKKENSIITYVWGICILLVLATVLFFPWMKYACKRDTLNNFVLLLWGLCGVHFLYLFFLKENRKRITFSLPLFIGICVLFFQVLLIRYYYFRTGWDSAAVVSAAARAAKGDSIGLTNYFSKYPNNYFLTFLFSRVIYLGNQLHLSDLRSYYLLIMFQSVLSFIAGIELYLIINRLTGNTNLSFVAYIIYILLVVLSPWISIPYSDAVGLFFPVTILYIYMQVPQKALGRVMKYLAIGFLSAVGYKIKPTIVIPAISITIVESIKSVREKQFCSLLKYGCIFAVSIAASFLLANCCVSTLQTDADPEGAFGPAHFLAMGLNEDSMGIFSEADVRYSSSFATREERNKGDIELVLERVSEMKFSGILQQLARKTLTNFNDGSFAWNCEGEFFNVVYECRDKIIAPYIRSFYYPEGFRYHLFLNTEQSVWLTVLFLSFFSVFIPQNEYGKVIMLSLVGMTVYGWLFEARARYFYHYAPFFIILSALGLKKIVNMIESAKTKQRNVDLQNHSYTAGDNE